MTPVGLRTVFVVATICVLVAFHSVSGQEPEGSAGQESAAVVDPGSSAAESPTRESVLESARWRRMLRLFQEWLSVQKIHTAEQIADIKKRLDQQNDGMSVKELEDFLYDMEERLDVLMSPEADRARDWLSVLTLEARQHQVAPRGEFPNVFAMTASQLRQELRQFEQRRAQRAAAHRQFNRTQDQRVGAALDQQRAPRQAATTGVTTNPALNPALRHQGASPYAPRANPVLERDRAMYINSWGGVSFRLGM